MVAPQTQACVSVAPKRLANPPLDERQHQCLPHPTVGTIRAAACETSQSQATCCARAPAHGPSRPKEAVEAGASARLALQHCDVRPT